MEGQTLEDPFEWTVAQTVDAFRRYQNIWPGQSSKPPSLNLDSLEQALKDNDVDGLTLLTSLDHATLKEDLGIKSLGHRAWIFQAVQRLRTRSKKYAQHLSETTAQSHRHLSQSNLSALESMTSPSRPASLADSPVLASAAKATKSDGPEDQRANRGLDRSLLQPELVNGIGKPVPAGPIRNDETNHGPLDRADDSTVQTQNLPRENGTAEPGYGNLASVEEPKPKRRKMMPTFVRPLESDADGVGENAENQVSNPIPLPSSRGYLGKESLSRKDIFYGRIVQGEEIELDMDCEPLDCQSSDLEDNFLILPRSQSRTGRRRYVNALMKDYLRARPLQFSRNDRSYHAIRPYSAKGANGTRKTVFTLFQQSENGRIKTTMESSENWPEITGATVRTQQKRSSPLKGQLIPQADYFDGSDAANDWDYLMKWNNLDDEHSEPLNLARASQEEEDDGYDSDTWRSIEEEAREREERKKFQSNRVSREEVESTIREAENEIIREWRERHLSYLEGTARRMWRKARRQRNREWQIHSNEARINYLNDKRLADLRKNLSVEEWNSSDDLRRKCRNMEQSLYERERLAWQLSVLRMKIEPPYAPKRAKKREDRPPDLDGEDGERVEVLQSQSEGDSSSEESDLDNFILNDDVEAGGGEVNHGPRDQAEQKSSTDIAVGRDPFLDHGHDSTKELVLTFDSPTPDKDEIDPSKFAPPDTRLKTTDGSKVVDLTIEDSGSEEDLSFSLIQTPPTNPNEKPSSPLSGIKEEIEPLKDISEMIEADPVSSMNTKDEDGHVKGVDEKGRRAFVLDLIQRMSSKKRTALAQHLRHLSSPDLHLEVKDVLEAILRRQRSCRGMDPETFEDLSRLAYMYLYWFAAGEKWIQDDPQSVPAEVIKAAKKVLDPEDPASFLYFYDFVIDTFERLGYFISRDEANEGPRFPQAHPGPAKRQKRNHNVVENVQAKQVRESHRERVDSDKERRRHLEERLRNLGQMSQNNPSQIPINPGKFDNEKLIYVNIHAGRLMKTHQIEGVQFMWRELVADQASLQGCLLAHTMGLGKTMQVVTFLFTLARAAQSKDPGVSNQIPEHLKTGRTLVLCPPSLIDNWWDEFIMWTPPGGHGVLGLVQKVHGMTKASERVEIEAWYKSNGVLLLSYDKFRNYVTTEAPKSSTNLHPEDPPADIRHMLLNGPSVIVADEAHKIRNISSKIAQAACLFKSKSRIALTGSPLANNLEEYHSMINWLAPGYLGPLAEFRFKYVSPIQEGLYIDSSPWERRKGMKMLWVLKNDLEPKVNRADVSLLRGSLTPKTEFLIKIPLTKIQADSYRLYIRSMLQNTNQDVYTASLWDWLALLGLLCTHPLCLRDKLLEREKDQKAVKEIERKSDPESPSTSSEHLEDEDPSAFGDAPPSEIGITKSLLEEQLSFFEGATEDLGSVGHSNKIVLFERILDLAKKEGDKTLVFSHSLRTLDFLETLFRRRGRRYERLDGRTKMLDRQQSTKEFNRGSSDVFLISTKAGGLGLNLYGANRVVIFDFNWNPSWEEQAVGRAYRLGQTKPVYVYRFITGGTFEDVIHNKIVFKLQLALNVIDKRNVKSIAEKSAREYLFEPKDVEQKDLSDFKDKDKAVLDSMLSDSIFAERIRSIELTETFREDTAFDISEEDRQEADQLLKDRQLERSDPDAYQRLVRQRLTTSVATKHAQQADRIMGLPDADMSIFSQRSSLHATQPAPRTTPILPPSFLLAQSANEARPPVPAATMRSLEAPTNTDIGQPAMNNEMQKREYEPPKAKEQSKALPDLDSRPKVNHSPSVPIHLGTSSVQPVHVNQSIATRSPSHLPQVSKEISTTPIGVEKVEPKPAADSGPTTARSGKSDRKAPTHTKRSTMHQKKLPVSEYTLHKGYFRMLTSFRSMINETIAANKYELLPNRTVGKAAKAMAIEESQSQARKAKGAKDFLENVEFRIAELSRNTNLFEARLESSERGYENSNNDHESDEEPSAETSAEVEPSQSSQNPQPATDSSHKKGGDDPVQAPPPDSALTKSLKTKSDLDSESSKPEKRSSEQHSPDSPSAFHHPILYEVSRPPISRSRTPRGSSTPKSKTQTEKPNPQSIDEENGRCKQM